MHLAFRGSVPDAQVEQLHAQGVRTFALPPAGSESSSRLVIHPTDANGTLVEVLAPRQS